MSPYHVSVQYIKWVLALVSGIPHHFHPTFKMAPSATWTTTLPTRETSTVKLTGGIGPYKELAPIGYEKEAEEQGKDGFAAAKVSLL